MAGVLLRPVWPVARREEGASPTSGAVTDEQRSHRPNWAQPKGRQSFSLQASLLTPYRSTSGYARRSRLAWTEKPLAAKHQPFRRHNTRLFRPPLLTKWTDSSEGVRW